MPQVETGLFILVLAMGMAFTFISFKSQGNVRGIFHISAVALLMITTVWTASGYEVSATTTSTDGTTTWTETKVMIAGGEDSGWLGYLFLGMAALNLVLFVKDVSKAE